MAKHFRGFYENKKGKSTVKLSNGEVIRGDWVNGAMELKVKWTWPRFKELHIVPNTISRKTQFEDKNGKPIYEYDVVEWFDHDWSITERYIVSFLENGNVSLVNLYDPEDEMQLKGAELYKENAIVIGNIFENPDLLGFNYGNG